MKNNKIRYKVINSGRKTSTDVFLSRIVWALCPSSLIHQASLSAGNNNGASAHQSNGSEITLTPSLPCGDPCYLQLCFIY